MGIIEHESVGVQIDALFDLREELRALEARKKQINALIEERKQILLVALDANGDLQGARGRRASASIKESVVPTMEDWIRLTAFIRRFDKFELLEKRVSAPAFRELAAQRRDKTVPGLVPFTKRDISLVKVS